MVSPKSISLTSGSKNRKEILSRLGINFKSITSGFAEDLDKSSFEKPSDYVIANAKKKCLNVYDRLLKVDIIISADTVGYIDGEILEKPRDREDALRILKKLNDRTHKIYTGVSILISSPSPSAGLSINDQTNYQIHEFYEVTEVTFRNCDDECYLNYIDTGEPMDKAGAYAYQFLGAFFVEKINGCYYNVVGLPIRVFSELENLLKGNKL
ncbi:4617_t:CDS:2 [Entrophospora sp. SA101]|nr:7095_t:CDS:2 [Entrophospora sp. SA101]CAJ0745258.1 4617_t:CDS:2 [Entrophospora sp. SA101]CAJ0855321.1 3519_t:CDS:2 [Entrophospora sp. SA101]